jgi:Na+/H+ antiporter NhaD/arsenite permease-like protein
MDFIINLAPFSLILLILLPFFVRLFYKKEMSQNIKEAWEKVEKFDEKKAIEDPVLLKKSLMVFLLTISIFIFHHNLGLEAATVALAGATLLLLVSNIDPAETFLEVEWSTLFFFIGLFVVIAGVEKVGIIQWLSNKIITLTKGNLTLTTMAVLWVSGITCSFVNNISYKPQPRLVGLILGCLSGRKRNFYCRCRQFSGSKYIKKTGQNNNLQRFF